MVTSITHCIVWVNVSRLTQLAQTVTLDLLDKHTRDIVQHKFRTAKLCHHKTKQTEYKNSQGNGNLMPSINDMDITQLN